jgi:formate dehydrogenase subunit delta
VSGTSIEHLITMANQIVANIPADSTEAKIDNSAVHIERFWSPSMKKNIAEFIAEGGAGLTPLAAKAVAQAVDE